MQRLFYATVDDLASILAEVEQKYDIAYTLFGLFESPAISPITSGSLIPTLRAETQQHSAPHCPEYIVSLKGTPFHVREVPQRSGEVKYAADLMVNPDCIRLCTGGLVGTQVLLPGSIGTTSCTAIATKLHKAFASSLGRHFVRKHLYWVGPGARNLFEHGTRLTTGEKSPTEYDLIL